jgi:1-acyl-sn-glycerol-3-phosphate acyltransferase
MSKHDDAPERYESPLYKYAFPGVHLLLRMLFRFLAPRWTVTGRGNIPRRGPCLLAPNHISDCDPPLVGLSSLRPLWFMAKSELFDIRVIGPWIRFCRAFPVERDNIDRSALRFTEELLGRRQAVVVFPEGRLSLDGELATLLPGVVMLALRAGVPIVPVGVCGSNAILPYGAVVPRPTLARVHVHFGEPIDFSDLGDLPGREQRQRANRRLEQGLRQAIAIARGAPALPAKNELK